MKDKEAGWSGRDDVREPTGAGRPVDPDGRAGESGQATAEYALVMLAAAAVAGGVLAWVIGSDAVGRLMDAVFASVIGEVSG